MTSSVVTFLDRPATPRGSSPELACQLVNLGPLIASGPGRAEVTVGLIDGPVAIEHRDLASEMIHTLRGRHASCTLRDGAACLHGTFVAGILSARRGSGAPALCPGCRLVVRPIFTEAPSINRLPTADADDLAAAVLECIDAGAKVLNVSATLVRASARDEQTLQSVLDYACQRRVAVVAAAGNASAIGGSVITRHPWVIPVVAYSLRGRALTSSNLGAVIGRHGLGGPGENITSLRASVGTATSSGTSVAAPFITGTFALLLSAFPDASVSEVRGALTHSGPSRRRTVVPPLLDARAAYQTLRAAQRRR